jgi:Zn-dependent protease with chaperone function
LGGILVLAVFYVTVILASIALLIYSGLVAVVGFCLALSGIAPEFLGEQIGRELALFLLIPTTLLTGKPVEYDLLLSIEQAPGLFAMIEEIARETGVPVPDEVRLVAGVDAAARLHEYGGGRGPSRLTVGFDLLTGLPVDEIRAALALAMAHARLVQRGFGGWLWMGFARMSFLVSHLDSMIEEARQARNWFPSARLLRVVFRIFALLGTAMIARSVRQSQFAADREAARVCGPETHAKALLRSRFCSRRSRELGWRDRILAHQQEVGYYTWLREKLQDDSEIQTAPLLEEKAEAHDRDAFRLRLADRLAALPGELPRVLPPFARSGADELLRSADSTAEQLLDRYEQVAADEERKQNRSLLGPVRAQHKKSYPGRCATVGRYLLAGAVLCWLYLLVAGVSWSYFRTTSAFVCLPALAGAVALFVASRRGDGDPIDFFSPVDLQEVLRRQQGFRTEYRPLSPGPRPNWPASRTTRQAVLGVTVAIALLTAVAWARMWAVIAFTGPYGVIGGFCFWVILMQSRKFVWSLPADDRGMLALLAQQVRQSLAGLPPAEQARRLEEEARTAFVRCDFLRAVAVSRICMELEPRKWAVWVIHAVSCAFFGDDLEARLSLEPVLMRESVTPAVAQALGWIAYLAGDVALCEGYFLHLVERAPGTADGWKCLAFAQRLNGH